MAAVSGSMNDRIRLMFVCDCCASFSLDEFDKAAERVDTDTADSADFMNHDSKIDTHTCRVKQQRPPKNMSNTRDRTMTFRRYHFTTSWFNSLPVTVARCHCCRFYYIEIRTDCFRKRKKNKFSADRSHPFIRQNGPGVQCEQIMPTALEAMNETLRRCLE